MFDFEVNKGVVDDALKRLTAYESRLDQAVAAISGARPAMAPKSLDAPAAPSEKWMIHSAERRLDSVNETLFLILPTRFARWYLPELDVENVTSDKLPVKNYVSKIEFLAGEVVLHELYPFWRWHESEFRTEITDAAVLDRVKRAEMAFLQTTAEAAAEPVLETIVRDPRLESRARAFWREADRLRFPDFAAPARFAPLDELLADPNLIGLDAVVKYERLRFRAQQAMRLRGEDLDDGLQLERARGAVIFALQEELRGTADTSRLASVPLSPSHNPPRELGLIAHLPDAVARQIDKVRIFRYNGANDVPVDEIATALPSRSGVPRFRALPWGLEIVEADSAQAELGVTGSVIVQLPLYIPDELLVAKSAATVRLGRIDIYRQFPGEERKRIAKGKLPGVTRFFTEDEKGPVLYTFPEPVVHSDIFPIRGDALADPRIVVGRTPILYIYEVFDNRGRLLDTGEWSPVRLFIPSDEALPSNLCIVVAVEDLVPTESFVAGSAAPNHLPLALCTLKEGVPARLDLSAKDVEIYVDEQDALSSGFYTGDEFRPTAEHPTAFLDDVRGDHRMESIDGKIRLDSLRGERGLLAVDRTDLFPGRSYRFFVRLTTGNEDVLTLPAAVGLVQRREELSRPEKVQIARHLEWPETLPSVVCLPKSKFSVDGMVFQDSNWIRVTWDARSAGDGGAEVIVVDRHDPGLVVRQRVEVFSESVFGQSQQHLGIPGGWTLDVCDLHGAEGKTPQPIAPSGPEEWPGYYVNQVVLLTRRSSLIWIPRRKAPRRPS